MAQDIGSLPADLIATPELKKSCSRALGDVKEGAATYVAL